MADDSNLRAAAAAGLIGSEEAFRSLIQSTVDVARAIFGARASSVFLLDETTDELVFEAVSGEGEGELIGMRIPSSTGISGWVLTTRQPIVIEDLHSDPRWSRETAESTGYVPKGMMCVPLLHDERALGVLSVLDRATEERFTLTEMDLLSLFANQAAIALELLIQARRAKALLETGAGEEAVVARIAQSLRGPDGEITPDGMRLLSALETVLK